MKDRRTYRDAAKETMQAQTRFEREQREGRIARLLRTAKADRSLPVTTLAERFRFGKDTVARLLVAHGLSRSVGRQ